MILDWFQKEDKTTEGANVLAVRTTFHARRDIPGRGSGTTTTSAGCAVGHTACLKPQQRAINHQTETGED
jgi:hypothetical protein